MSWRGTVAYAGVQLAGLAGIWLWIAARGAGPILACVLGTIGGGLVVCLRDPSPQRAVTVAVAPFVVIVAAIAWTAGFAALGADCPRSGIDYLDQCNTRATLAMTAWLWGPFTFATTLATFVLFAVVRLAGRAWRTRLSPAARGRGSRAARP